jgi:serine/threonine protein phosphatase PrpC
MKKLNFRSNFDEYIHDDYTFTYNAISVSGERHQRNNEANQDFFTCNIRNEVKYAIVSDGLGSAIHSDKGAEKAVTWLEQMILENFTNKTNVSEVEMNLFHSEFLEAWKKSFPNTYRDYDTTLLYVIIFNHGVLAGSVGDGLILSFINNEAAYLKENRDSFSNQTYSLASNHAINNFRSIYKPINFTDDLPGIFILATDGVSDDLKPEMVEQLPVYLYGELTDKGVIHMQKVIGDWIINWQTSNHTDDRTFCILSIGREEKNRET